MAASGVRGIERDAGLLAEPADHLQRAVEMLGGLGVDGDDIGAGLGEGFEIEIDRLDHEMHVEHLLRARPDAFDEARPEGDVRHEMAVHDIDMHPVAARFVDGADLLAEAGEIGREDGGGNKDIPAHGFPILLFG